MRCNIGDYNKLEGVCEIPLGYVPCTTCQDTPGKVGDEVCPVCEGSGHGQQVKTLKLRGRLRNIVKCEFEDWLELQARMRLFSMHGKIPQEYYDESMLALQKSIASYTFAWGGDAYREAILQLPGRVQLLMLLVKDADRLTGKVQDITEIDLINAMKQDSPSAPMMSEALTTIIRATPNFLAPPIRGTAATID